MFNCSYPCQIPPQSHYCIMLWPQLLRCLFEQYQPFREETLGFPCAVIFWYIFPHHHFRCPPITDLINSDHKATVASSPRLTTTPHGHDLVGTSIVSREKDGSKAHVCCTLESTFAMTCSPLYLPKLHACVQFFAIDYYHCRPSSSSFRGF